MVPETLTLYKLIVLYMLNRVTFPLSKAQVSDFMLEKEYTDYLTLQQAIDELSDAGLLTEEKDHSRTLLVITEDGRQTLRYFGNRIGKAIKTDINLYLKENEMTLRSESAVRGVYYKSTTGEYEAHLTAREGDITLMDIKLSVPTAETAAAICDNWQEKNETIYQYLTQELF